MRRVDEKRRERVVLLLRREEDDPCLGTGLTLLPGFELMCARAVVYSAILLKVKKLKSQTNKE